MADQHLPGHYQRQGCIGFGASRGFVVIVNTGSKDGALRSSGARQRLIYTLRGGSNTQTSTRIVITGDQRCQRRSDQRGTTVHSLESCRTILDHLGRADVSITSFPAKSSRVSEGRRCARFIFLDTCQPSASKDLWLTEPTQDRRDHPARTGPTYLDTLIILDKQQTTNNNSSPSAVSDIGM